MIQTIQQKIRQIEADFNVKVVYACEAGSHAWGFASPESDYDVRFLFVYPLDTYLRIDPVGTGGVRDVIELPVTPELDVNGWDLAKALRLLRKSNPSILEWIFSGIVYENRFSAAGQLQQLSEQAFSAESCLRHYRKIAEKNVRALAKKPDHNLKLALHTLRPLLAGKWIQTHHSVPPVHVQKLLAGLPLSPALQQEIGLLMTEKADGKSAYLLSDELTAFMASELPLLHQSTDLKKKPPVTEPLNDFFRSMVKQAWNK